MKLLPVMIFIILAFVIAFLFRGYNLKKRGYQITGLSKKVYRILTIILLIFLVGFLFKFMGKIAILIGAIIAVIALLSFRKG